jgi:uncharacterized protein YukE
VKKSYFLIGSLIGLSLGVSGIVVWSSFIKVDSDSVEDSYALSKDQINAEQNLYSTQMSSQLKNLTNKIESINQQVGGRISALQRQFQDEILTINQNIDIFQDALDEINDELSSFSLMSSDNVIEHADLDHSEQVTPELMEEASENFQAINYVNQFESEAVDPSWAQWAIAEIGNSIETHNLAGSTLVSTDCRSTLCRIEVSFDDQVARDASLGSFPLIVPWDSHGFAYIDEQSGGNAVLFVAREGE